MSEVTLTKTSFKDYLARVGEELKSSFPERTDLIEAIENYLQSYCTRDLSRLFNNISDLPEDLGLKLFIIREAFPNIHARDHNQLPIGLLGFVRLGFLPDLIEGKHLHWTEEATEEVVLKIHSRIYYDIARLYDHRIRLAVKRLIEVKGSAPND